MKNNWPTKKLGEVLDICDAGIWGKESEDGMPLLRSTNMQKGELVLDDLAFIDVSEDKKEKYTLEEGDILITKSSGSVDHIGKSLFITKEMSGKYGFSNFTQRLRVNKSIVLPKWVYLKISNPATRDFLLGASQTTTGLRNLKISALKELELPIPPLSEQKKIVERLEKMLTKIKEAKRLRAEAQEAAQNLLSAELHKIFEEGKKKGWEECNIGDEKVMKMTSGGTPARGNKSYYNGNISWLKSGELNDNINILDSEEHVSEEAIKNSSAKIFPKNTVLLAMYGATAGKLGILKNSAATNQAVAGIICNEEKLDHMYLFYVLMDIRNQIVAKAWGGAQPNLSQTIIKKFKIPLPHLSEQKKIITRLDALSEKIQKLQAHQKQSAADLLSLEQSILHKAFKN